MLSRWTAKRSSVGSTYSKTSILYRYAIAHAVLSYLSGKVECRVLFATHYHPLTTEFAEDPKVKLGYMTAALANPGSTRTDVPCITFLYKLQAGTSPQSYGLQVPATKTYMSNSDVKRFQELTLSIGLSKSWQEQISPCLCRNTKLEGCGSFCCLCWGSCRCDCHVEMTHSILAKVHDMPYSSA